MTATFNDRSLKSIVDKEALTFAKYSVEERAIPNHIDGLKPVHRFFLYSVMQSASTKFNKVAAIGGRVSELGYHHGETSAADSGALMASTWSNNLPIVEGDGNFGSRMVQEASAARYVFARLHENFNKYFKDTNLAPVHPDPEHLPPMFYLPTIPYVLVNGSFGIATGFRTDIPPHSVDSVVECVKEYITHGDCKEPLIQFPDFKGDIFQNDEECYMVGKYELIGKTKLLIKEIPYAYDREKYVMILDDLVDRDIIVRYEDLCGEDDFDFEVILKRDFNPAKIVDVFKLKQNIPRNLVVITHDRKVKVYASTKDMLKDFVDFRMPFYDTRIQNELAKAEDALRLAEAKVVFIEAVLSGEIDLKGKTRLQAIKAIESNEKLVDFSDNLIKMNIYHLTTDEIKKLKQDITRIKKDVKYWKSTDSRKEYLNDLG